MEVRYYVPRGHVKNEKACLAIQLMAHNVSRVYNWIPNSELSIDSGDNSVVIVFLNDSNEPVTVLYGDWVVWTRDKGFFVLSEQTFQARYETIRSPRRYEWSE